MIKYTLRCADGHDFESWFRDMAAFDILSKAGQIACSTCGSSKVKKAIMAPAVSGTTAAEPEAPLSTPASPAEAALAEMRKHLEQNSDYVGQDFANEARRIHMGESDARAIWGEATTKDAKALKDEGIPVAPIPWIAKRDS